MIDLTSIPMSDPTPHYIDFGADLEPAFGGVSQRVDFYGGKHSLDIQTPPMPGEPDGRIWVSRLKRAKKQGGFLRFPQPGLDTGSPGAVLIAAVAIGGTSVSLKGLSAGYVLREGQWITISHAGRRYLYSIDAQVTASGGSAIVQVSPMLRSPLSVNDVVDIAAPLIEGYVRGDEVAWTISNAKTIGLSFTIVEKG